MSFTKEEVKSLWIECSGSGWILEDSFFGPTLVKFANELFAKRKGEPIDPENIRVGDEVEITRHDFGMREVASGIVVRISELGGLYTEGNGYLGNIEDEATFHLIHRPAPKLKAGQVIRVDETGVHGKHLIDREVFVHSTDTAVSNAGTIVVVDIQDDKSERIHRDLITAFTVLWPTEESK